MKNLVMALMMLLVLGTGFLLGSKQSLNDNPADILELTNNTSDNVNNQNYLNGNLSKNKEEYETTNNQKYDFEDSSNAKSNKEKEDTANNESINEEQNDEDDSNSKNEDNNKKENSQSVKSISYSLKI
ncbi:hypothetical protein [Methanobacterium oryzae]|uniref:hypothetical protein n=1 Tax=Methanobacterium oryzae TaxID=69540 RepID=UPI003D222FE2